MSGFHYIEFEKTGSILLNAEEKDELFGYIDRLKAENERLRRLVRYIMHQCNDGNPRCDECIGWNDGECVALQRMREVGIGVGA